GYAPIHGSHRVARSGIAQCWNRPASQLAELYSSDTDIEGNCNSGGALMPLKKSKLAKAETRAARFRGAGCVALETIAVRPPQPGEALVKLEGCGVCGSNLPVWEGRPWFKYPLEPGTPGHEGWGVIEAVGEGVREFAVGDRVALLSAHAYAQHDFATPEA